MTLEEFNALFLERGTILRVEWEDVYEDPTASTRTGDVVTRSSFGIFWEQKTSPSTGSPLLMTTTTIDSDGPENQGFTAYPLSLIRELEIIRRPRRGRKKKKEPTPSV